MEDLSFRNAEDMEREGPENQDGDHQATRKRNISHERPNRDYFRHINWTNDLNKDLYECYIQSEHERIGYMKRLKALWDNKRPELAHLSERHLREQATRIIKKNLIPQGLTDQRTCEMDRTNEPVPEELTRQTTSEFIRTHDPPAPPPSMQTIYELDSYFEDNVDCIFEMEQSENRDTEMLLNPEDQLLYEELKEKWTFQFDKYKNLAIGK